MAETPTDGYIAENFVVIPFIDGIAQSPDYLSLDVDQYALTRRLNRALRHADSATVVYGPGNIGIVNNTDQIPGAVDMIFRALEVLRNQRAVPCNSSMAVRDTLDAINAEPVSDTLTTFSVKKSRGDEVPKLTMTFSDAETYEETLTRLEDVLGISADGSGDEHSDNYTGGRLTYLSLEKGHVHVTS